jgi:hypothetical protein
LVTQGILRPGLSTKLLTFPFNVLIDKPEAWKGTGPFRKTTTTNWVSSLLVSVLTGNDLTNESRHPCLMTSPPSLVRTRESELVGLDHLTNAVRRGKKKTKKCWDPAFYLTAGSLFNKGYLFKKEYIVYKVREGHSEGILGQ